MVLAILLIGLTLEETLHLYSLTLLEEIEERLIIILDPGLEALDGRRGNLHTTLLLGGLDGYAGIWQGCCSLSLVVGMRPFLFFYYFYCFLG